MVKVKGHQALSMSGQAQLWELGLASDQVQIIPHYYHKDIYADDFGPSVPPEVLWNIADVNIRMTLIHYDYLVLDDCIANSMGGSATGAGQLIGAGDTLGRGCGRQESGNCYISLNLTSPYGQNPWHFPTTYLAEQPVVIPLGTEKSLVQLNWRAIPYDRAVPGFALGAVASSGRILWDHTLDT